jgi:hypothetical protein
VSLDETVSESSADNFRLDCQYSIGYRKLRLRKMFKKRALKGKKMAECEVRKHQCARVEMRSE